MVLRNLYAALTRRGSDPADVGLLAYTTPFGTRDVFWGGDDGEVAEVVPSPGAHLAGDLERFSLADTARAPQGEQPDLPRSRPTSHRSSSRPTKVAGRGHVDSPTPVARATPQFVLQDHRSSRCNVVRAPSPALQPSGDATIGRRRAPVCGGPGDTELASATPGAAREHGDQRIHVGAASAARSAMPGWHDLRVPLRAVLRVVTSAGVANGRSANSSSTLPP